MKIADVKLLKNKYGVTFNDVITALTVSGIRKYILSQDKDYFTKNKDVAMTALLAFGMFIEVFLLIFRFIRILHFLGFPPKEEFRGQSDWLRNGFTMVDWVWIYGAIHIIKWEDVFDCMLWVTNYIGISGED